MTTTMTFETRFLTSSPFYSSMLPTFFQLAGNLAHLPASELNLMSAIWLISRVLYNFAYVYLEGFAPSLIRTLIFQVGIICGTRLFIKSGNKLY